MCLLQGAWFSHPALPGVFHASLRSHLILLGFSTALVLLCEVKDFRFIKVTVAVFCGFCFMLLVFVPG